MDTTIVFIVIWAAFLIPLLIVARDKNASTAIILCGILLGPLIGWIIYLCSSEKGTQKQKPTTASIPHITRIDPMAQWEMQQRIQQGPPPPPSKTLITDH